MNIVFPIIWLCAVVAAAIGWIMNIVQVVHLATANAPVTVLFVVKIIGIFAAPLGVILGYV